MKLRRASWSVPLLAVAACASSVDLAETTTPPPGITVTATAPSLEVPRGGVLLVVANVTRLGNFAGDATIVVDGVPDGIRAQISSVQTLDGVTSALLAVAVDPTVPMADYNLTVRAVAFGVPDASVALRLTVDAPGTPVYTLSSRPISVVRGSSASGFASIDRGLNTLDVPVTLVAENVPGGVTATLYPTTNYKALSTMTVTVAANVAPGHYTFSVRGVAPGLADRTAIIPLTVLAGP